MSWDDLPYPSRRTLRSRKWDVTRVLVSPLASRVGWSPAPPILTVTSGRMASGPALHLSPWVSPLAAAGPPASIVMTSTLAISVTRASRRSSDTRIRGRSISAGWGRARGLLVSLKYNKKVNPAHHCRNILIEKLKTQHAISEI